MKHLQVWAVRISFFIIYFWFGITKVLDVSPASSLVLDLLKQTLPFVPPQNFLPAFGSLEMLIGLGFLFPKVTRYVVVLTAFHLVATMLPLLVLPQHTWATLGVLSTEGQYIMKNLVLFAALWGLYLDYKE